MENITSDMSPGRIPMEGAVNNAYQLDEVPEETKQLRNSTNNISTEQEDNNVAITATNNKTEQIIGENSEDDRSRKYKPMIIVGLKVLLNIAVVIYFAYATYYYLYIKNNKCNPFGEMNALCGIQFCDGYGMLVLLYFFVYLGIIYYMLFKPKIGQRIYYKTIRPFGKWWKHFSRLPLVSIILIVLLLTALAIFLYFETRSEPQKLVALVAPSFFILTGFIFSTARSEIKWRTVITGISCQFLLGVICIRWDVGRAIFECLGNKIAAFLAFTDEGSRFVYGDKIIDEGIFAFAILSVIFFFSFFISVLYYMGVMQWVVMKLGWLLQQIIGTTVCESVNAAANIFLGMSESPLLIRPYIKLLTASEIHSIMVSGFATVSGTVLAAYLSFGASAAHLITSSVMAAPATLAISKLYMPETEVSKTTSQNIQLEKSEDSSVLDAASTGATNAVPIVLGIIANIIAFVAFIAFLNAIVRWLGWLVGLEDIDFEWIFAKLFIPLAWSMGVPYEDCDIVAKVVATKTIINEFVAYERLGEYIKNGDISARSAGIATFAICGFANPSSLGILIGSLSAMAPNRKALITSVAFRAFIVGSIVCFISASFAGILIVEEEESRIYQRIFNQLERRNVSINALMNR